MSLSQSTRRTGTLASFRSDLRFCNQGNKKGQPSFKKRLAFSLWKSAFWLMGERIVIGSRENFRTFGIRRAVTELRTFAQGLPIVFGEAVQSCS